MATTTKLNELHNATVKALNNAVKADGAVDISVPELLKAAISEFVNFAEASAELPPVKREMKDGKTTNAEEYLDYVEQKETLDAQYSEITKALTIENADAISGLTSATAIKLIETLKKFVQDETKRGIIVECFQTKAYKNYNKDSMAALQRFFRLVEQIIKPTKFEDTVAKKDDVWKPRHITVSADLKKIELKLDKAEDSEYLNRLEEFNATQKGTTNAYKMVNTAILNTLKAKAKERKVKKLGDLEAAKVTLEVIEAKAKEIATLIKELEATEKEA